MINSIVDEQELLNALDDLGMEHNMIEQFMKNFHSSQWDNSKKILLSHRSKLLSDVHKTQDKLYCMDFLIRKLKTSRSLYDK